MKRWISYLFLAGLFFTLATDARAQGGFAQGISWRYTPAGAFPAGGSTVTVCTTVGTGAPCTPKVSLYADSGLSIPVANPLIQCTMSPQTGCIDNLGNFSFYAASGVYTYTITGVGLTPYGPIPIQAINGTGGFTGTIGANQVAFGSGLNAFTGSADFQYIPANGGLLFNVSNIGPANVTGSAIAITNTIGGATSYIFKHSDNSFGLRNDAASIPANGYLAWDGGTGNLMIWGGGNSSQLTFYANTSVSPFGMESIIFDMFSTGGGPHVVAVRADPGAGDKGYVSIDPFASLITFGGDVSGSAAIGTGTAAGSPNKIYLPIGTGTTGTFLQTDGGNPQQTIWDTLVVDNGTTLAYTGTGGVTAASLLATGIVDGKVPVIVTTGTSGTPGATYNQSYSFNEEATAGTGVNYTLPTAAAGKKYCIANAYNGSAANTGILTITTSASGQFIIFTDGTLSASGGNVTSAGAAADSACVVGVDATHWFLDVHAGTWTKH